MSTAAQRAAASAAKLAAGRAPAEPVAPQRLDDEEILARPISTHYVRTDPVRSTVDLGPARHAALVEWETAGSVALGMTPGRRGITRNMTLECLVAVLLTDELVSRRVLAYISEHRPRRGRRP